MSRRPCPLLEGSLVHAWGATSLQSSLAFGVSDSVFGLGTCPSSLEIRLESERKVLTGESGL